MRLDGTVTLVTTDLDGSIDVYAKELAAHLPVASVRIPMTGTSAETFGAPLMSWASAKGVVRDADVVRRLRRIRGIPHLPHHHMARYGPLLGRPFILTVHDIIRWLDLTGRDHLIHHPNRRDAIGLRRDYAAFGRAAAIVAVSETTRQDLIRELHLPEEKVFTVHHGIDLTHFRPGGPRPIPDPYVLYVGTEQPRKNLPLLLEAFAQLKADPAFHDLKLVKVGGPGTGEAPFRARTLEAIQRFGLEMDVILTGRVPDEALPAYYTHAACFVLPSRYEGFGIPPIEAMACECPVIVSTAGSLPEVVGDAALKVDPSDAAGLVQAMRRLLTDAQLRTDMVVRGREQVRRYGWDVAVERMLAVYDEVLGRPALGESRP